MAKASSTAETISLLPEGVVCRPTPAAMPSGMVQVKMITYTTFVHRVSPWLLLTWHKNRDIYVVNLP